MKYSKLSEFFCDGIIWPALLRLPAFILLLPFSIRHTNAALHYHLMDLKFSFLYLAWKDDRDLYIFFVGGLRDKPHPTPRYQA